MRPPNQTIDKPWSFWNIPPTMSPSLPTWKECAPKVHQWQTLNSFTGFTDSLAFTGLLFFFFLPFSHPIFPHISCLYGPQQHYLCLSALYCPPTCLNNLNVHTSTKKHFHLQALALEFLVFFGFLFVCYLSIQFCLYFVSKLQLGTRKRYGVRFT